MEDFKLDGARPEKVSITRQTMSDIVSLLEVELREGEFESNYEYQKTCEILEECRKSLEERSTKHIDWNPIYLRQSTPEEKDISGFDETWEGVTPDRDGTYLISLKNGNVLPCEVSVELSEGLSFDGYDDEVIAWAELPEPYQEKK